MLIAMAGLPGTGKSYLARALAAALPGIILDKDPIRAALFPPEEIEYSTEQDDFCLSVMLEVTGYLLRKDARKSVILDGRPFARRYQRAQPAAFAKAHGIPFLIIECVCSEATARRRLEHDAGTSGHLARNRDYALYQAMKATFEPILEPRILIDTDQPIELCLAESLAYVHRCLADGGSAGGGTSSQWSK